MTNFTFIDLSNPDDLSDDEKVLVPMVECLQKIRRDIRIRWEVEMLELCNDWGVSWIIDDKSAGFTERFDMIARAVLAHAGKHCYVFPMDEGGESWCVLPTASLHQSNAYVAQQTLAKMLVAFAQTAASGPTEDKFPINNYFKS